MASHHRRGFTLLELLVVIGIIAALSFVLVGGLSGGGKSAALEAGQATLANLVTAARIRAMATGHRVRVLINADVAAGAGFRRLLALQEETPLGVWQTRESFRLPDGIYVLPYRGRAPAGIMADPTAWTKFSSAAALESSVLSAVPLNLAVEATTPQNWDYLQFVPAGTISGGGDLVLATGRSRAPGTYAPGDSPVRLENPETVRGITLSAYGLPRMINDRRGF